MKKSSSGTARRLSPWRRLTVAPSAISGGGVSPIGEPLATLPPTVPGVADLLAGDAVPELGELREMRRPIAPCASV